MGAEGGGRGSSFFSTCTGFLHQGAPTPVTKLPIPRHLGSASSKLSNWGPIRRSAPPPDSSLLACLRGQRRQGFHTSHSFLSGGGGDAGAKETEQRLGEGKGNREDGDRKVETKMRNGQRQPDCLSACGCAHGGTALQARCRCLLPPVASPGNLQDFLGRSWIPEQSLSDDTSFLSRSPLPNTVIAPRPVTQTVSLDNPDAPQPALTRGTARRRPRLRRAVGRSSPGRPPELPAVALCRCKTRQ